MDKKQNISLFEKDYAYEINNTEIDIELLKKAGVPMAVLSAEVYLRKFYGDVIHSSSIVDAEYGENEKKVQKLEDVDMAIDKDYKKICEEIEASEFDKSLDSLWSS